MTAPDVDATPQGTYCEACREVVLPFVELCEVPSGQKFTFCQFCACEHGALPVAEMDEARMRVWENLKRRAGV